MAFSFKLYIIYTSPTEVLICNISLTTTMCHPLTLWTKVHSLATSVVFVNFVLLAQWCVWYWLVWKTCFFCPPGNKNKTYAHFIPVNGKVRSDELLMDTLCCLGCELYHSMQFELEIFLAPSSLTHVRLIC